MLADEAQIAVMFFVLIGGGLFISAIADVVWSWYSNRNQDRLESSDRN